MKRIISKDGTSIACWQEGIGDPLLLVHGTTSDHLAWSPVTLLKQQFSVWTMDRRGRGHSKDSPNYSLERECEDIAAVIDAIGTSVHLVGHSFGGLCSLEATRLTNNLQSLILYEPSISLAGSGWSSAVKTSMERLHDSEDWEEVLLHFYRDILKTPRAELVALQTGPGWKARVATSHTVLRELRSIDHYVFNPQRFNSLQIPVLLLLGGDSSSRRYETASLLSQGLPNNRIGILHGQQHSAMRTAPDLFAHEIMKFLKEQP
ncbi:alpha/beta fold hydrolase [Nitrosomonas marina]|uniref:Pimeloyl-ACP methyl ester carboxylesterase n=1 Tax=Nitrosomonas marina TaxID=917 RepID=A0A1H8AJB5_9PROT|nr:alpha/beta hydrolase [Nitrosomonas marina]SEM69617.1 Pimeloyl-ACP methyl ester carboxylesterase [Nitrosomonas marina]